MEEPDGKQTVDLIYSCPYCYDVLVMRTRIRSKKDAHHMRTQPCRKCKSERTRLVTVRKA